MKSRLLAKLGTSYALSIVGWLADTAADKSNPFGFRALLNSSAHNAKLSLSLDGPALQSAYNHRKKLIASIIELQLIYIISNSRM